MTRIRMRTKFLLSLLLVSVGLTAATLLIVRHSVQVQMRRQIFGELRNSVLTFQNVQRQGETTLTRSAELLANIPNLKALMTTQDATTIQDASKDLWRLAGSDLFVLADRAGKIAALHTSAPGLTRNVAQELLQKSLQQQDAAHWWFSAGRLYEVFLQPIYFGSPADNRPLGVLAVGYAIDERVAQEVSRVSASQVAFRYGDSVAASTLSSAQESELQRQFEDPSRRPAGESDEIQLGEERFLAASVELAPGTSPLVRLSVLKSFHQATAFLDNLNHLLLGLGLVAVLGGSMLVFLISHTFTRPLESLVAGVRGMEKGDYAYPLEARGSDEVAEVTGAFGRMRSSLQKTQQELLDSERLAVVGRMAGSISHDLRHRLAAIMANAEFLCESHLDAPQREDLYQEIRVAVNQMTDLIDSLMEFTSTRESLWPVYGSLADTVERAIQATRVHPEFHGVSITLHCEGRCESWFDPKKLERVFYNLLLNACEAVPADCGKVEVKAHETREGLEIRVADNGPGIPQAIRDKLFQPFVSYGKEKGTGLGLTTVQKIIQEHGGDVQVEISAPGSTVFLLVLPRASPSPALGGLRAAPQRPPLVPLKPGK